MTSYHRFIATDRQWSIEMVKSRKTGRELEGERVEMGTSRVRRFFRMISEPAVNSDKPE